MGLMGQHRLPTERPNCGPMAEVSPWINMRRLSNADLPFYQYWYEEMRCQGDWSAEVRSP